MLSKINILLCDTPQAWLKVAMSHSDILLVDHAHCEKKAASSAMNFIYHYPEHYELLQKMSRLIREEMRHYEQVLEIIYQRQIRYENISSSRYAGELLKHACTHEPWRLVDRLIVGAFIEARSCERFSALIPYVDDELKKFYRSLLKSESRHFEDYLHLAETLSPNDVSDRIEAFALIEKELIISADPLFRFHSGVPA